MAHSRLTHPDYSLSPEALELHPGPVISHSDFSLRMRGERDYVLRMQTDNGPRRWTISCKNNERFLELGLILAMIRRHGFGPTWLVQQRIVWGLRRMHVATGLLSLTLLIGGERLLGSSGFISAVVYSMALPSVISGVSSWMASRRMLIWSRALYEPEAIISQRQWLLIPHPLPQQNSPTQTQSDAPDPAEDEPANPFMPNDEQASRFQVRG